MIRHKHNFTIKMWLTGWAKINKINCSNTTTNNIAYNTTIYYNMPITRDWIRPYWISSGGCKKYAITKILSLKHNKFTIVCKIMIQYRAAQYSNTYVIGVSFKNAPMRCGQKITSVSCNRVGLNIDPSDITSK